MRKVLIIAAAALQLGACATATRGLTTPWEVHSAPAGAQVTTSHGRGCAATPCVIRVPRRSAFTATLTKDGYLPVTVPVSTHRDRYAFGAAALNMAFFGLVGVSGALVGAGVDAVDGSTQAIGPNPANVILPLADPTQPPPR